MTFYMYRVSFLLDWSSDATGILHRVKLEGGGREKKRERESSLQTTVHTKEQAKREKEKERERERVECFYSFYGLLAYESRQSM